MIVRLITALLTVAVVLTAEVGLAQSITVQQPVVGTFSVNTTVSVPDRGGTYLGGVKRAGESSSRAGFIPSGTSTGLFRNHSGASAHVWIHDFDEMDRLLLNRSTSGRTAPSGPPLTGHAGQAYRSLLARHGSRQTMSPLERPSRASLTGSLTRRYAPAPRAGRRRDSQRSSRTKSRAGRAGNYYRLGLKAQERGTLEVARLHFRMAARHGSASAQAKLLELDAHQADLATASNR